MIILQTGDLISVQKDGVITHPGIFVGDRGRGFNEVVHNTPRAGGVVRESFESFADGKEVSFVARAPAGCGQLHAERALSVEGTRYNLLTWNCEHFVTWVRAGRPESGQLKTGMAALLLAGVGVLLSTRPSYDANVGRYRNRAGQFSTWR
jgi:hypothetical protein